MLTINGIDMELPQIGREPTMGYADEYVEKTMISGKIRRIYKGRRFYANFSYAFLTAEQRTTVNSLLAAQRQNGYLDVQISSPFGSYNGQAIIELGQEQTRFAYSDVLGEYVWTNWDLTLKGVDYDDN
jgi:hypothetical protein